MLPVMAWTMSEVSWGLQHPTLGKSHVAKSISWVLALDSLDLLISPAAFHTK